MLHGDLNEQNLLVSPNAGGQLHISGLLDFGDSHRSALVFELALAVMYLMIDCPAGLPRLDVGGHVLAGYQRHRTLTPAEWRVLKVSAYNRQHVRIPRQIVQLGLFGVRGGEWRLPVC